MKISDYFVPVFVTGCWLFATWAIAQIIKPRKHGRER